MATLTKDRYGMCHQMNLLSIGSATSLLGSQDGLTLSDSQSGPQIERSGPDHALASPSQQQGNASLTTIPGISGRLGSSSSRSAALTLSLANRLRVVTDSLGSTLFRLTWSQRVTPSGRSIFALRASGHRTSGNGSILQAHWTSPSATETEESTESKDARNRRHIEAGKTKGVGSFKLGTQAQLACWRSPAEQEPGITVDRLITKEGNPWSGGERAYDRETGRLAQVGVAQEAQLASWPTASSWDWKGGYQGGRMRDAQLSLDTLDVVAQLTASGPMQSGSHAGMESGGQPDRGSALSLEGWRTPCDRDHHPSKIDGNNTRTDMQIQLAHQASLAGWPTPNTMDQIDREGLRPSRIQTNRDSGYLSETVARSGTGQLNPALSRWLMGLPAVWDDCAVTAMQSCRKSRKRS